MLKFYRYAASLCLIALVATALLIYGGAGLSAVGIPLLPSNMATIPWVPSVEPRTEGGNTTLSILEEGAVVDYDFYLSSETKYPYTSYAFNFVDAVQAPMLADLTPFNSVSFKVLCEPRNILLFVLFTFDDNTTELSKTATYRINSTFFQCDNEWRTVVVPLATLDTPDWWLQNSGLELIDREYQLGKVISFALVNSLQSPRDTASNIKIADVQLEGSNQYYVYASIGLSALLWGWALLLILRRYTNELVEQATERMRQDRPLIAYQKLSIEPQADKDESKGALLRYLATEYSNPDLSIDIAASRLGVQRSEINEILKAELGLAFSAYINKLRLTESARLLVEQKDMNISQIAYAVGFNNVTYFNRLFKNEYGCTPKMFKNNYPPTKGQL